MISGKVSNEQATELIERHVEILAASRQSYMVEFAVAVRQFIQQELVRVLQDRVRHFEIQIEQDGMNIAVKVVAISDVGRYIYYGTQPHTMVARSGEPMPMGGNRFMRAEHQGTKGMKEKIDNAITQGISDAKQAMGQLGMRG